MYQKKEYKTLRWVADITSGFGQVIVGLFGLMGLIIGWKAGGIIVGIIGGVFFGVIFGLPFIVLGQLVSVFLDQKELQEGILSAVSKSENNVLEEGK
jgi:hypothetical protein